MASAQPQSPLLHPASCPSVRETFFQTFQRTCHHSTQPHHQFQATCQQVTGTLNSQAYHLLLLLPCFRNNPSLPALPCHIAGLLVPERALLINSRLPVTCSCPSVKKQTHSGANLGLARNWLFQRTCQEQSILSPQSRA